MFYRRKKIKDNTKYITTNITTLIMKIINKLGVYNCRGKLKK